MFTIVAVLATLALAQAGPFSFGIGAHGAYGGYGGYGAHGRAHVAAHDKVPFLSCFESQSDSNTENAISVNIKPATYGYGAGYARLEATINVFSKAGGDAVIAFTKMADALGSGSCGKDGYGHLIGPSIAKTTFYGNLIGPSIVKTSITASKTASLHIAHLEGFTSLSQLAGRGVIVCKAADVEQDAFTGHWHCSTDPATSTTFPCCSLHYSGTGDTLTADGGQVSADGGQPKEPTPNTPTINVSPSETVDAGTTVTFTSTTTSAGAATYIFYKNGQVIGGAGPGATYTIPNAQVTAGAEYTSTATINYVESSSSNGVTLVVTDNYNDECRATADCNYGNAQCVTGVCKCDKEYKHDPLGNTCVSECVTYGDDFTVYNDLAIGGRTVQLGKIQPQEECLRRCAAEDTNTEDIRSVNVYDAGPCACSFSAPGDAGINAAINKNAKLAVRQCA